MENIKKLAIEKIINEWFGVNVVRAKEMKFSYTIKNEKMAKQCNYLHNKYAYNQYKPFYMVDYILEIYLAMVNFQATDLEWQAMANNSENSRLSELNLLSRSYAQYELKRSKLERSGRIMSINNKEVLVTLPTLSLDFIDEADNDGISLMDVLTSDSNIFNKNINQIYYKNSFRDWFDQNRSKILTKNQDQFIANMNNVNMQEHDNETVRSLVGIDKCKVNTKLDKIAERVVKAYNKQLPQNPNREQIELKQRIELLQPIVSMVYDDDLDYVNETIFNYVAEHFCDLQEYLQLSADECIAINRNEFNHKIVYKVAEQVEKKINTFRDQLTEADNAQKITQIESFRHIKKEDEGNNEMGVYIVVCDDGLTVRQLKDPYNKPMSSDVRVSKMG